MRPSRLRPSVAPESAGREKKPASASRAGMGHAVREARHLRNRDRWASLPPSPAELRRTGALRPSRTFLCSERTSGARLLPIQLSNSHLSKHPPPRGATRPSFVRKFHPPIKTRGRREGRVLSSHPRPVCKGRKHTGRTTGAGGIIRPSLRNGFNGLFRALPGDRAFLPPSPLIIRNLMPASGHQNHTTSPSAAAPLVMRRCRVHRIPHQRS